MPLQKNFQDIGVPSVVAPLNISVGEFIEQWIDIPGAGQKIPLSAIERLEKSPHSEESTAGQFLRLFKEKPAILKEYLTQNPKTLEELKKIRIKAPFILGESLRTPPKAPPPFIPKEIPADVILPKEAKERGLLKETQIRTLPKEIPADVILPKEARERGLLKETQIKTLPKEIQEEVILPKEARERGLLKETQIRTLRKGIPEEVILPKEAKERGLLKETQIRTLPEEISVTGTKKEVPKPTKEMKPVEKKEVRPPEPKEPKKSYSELVSESFKPFQELQKPYMEIEQGANKQIESFLTKKQKIYEEDIPKILENARAEQDKWYEKLEKEYTKPYPKPPTREEIVTPKQSLLAVLKDLTPLVVGLTALLRPGKYGENLFYFNSMYQAIRDSDDRKFKEALDNWQREMQIGLAEKQDRINLAKLEIEKVQRRTDVDITFKKLAISELKANIQIEENKRKLANEAIGTLEKLYKDISTTLYRQMELDIKQQQLEADILYKMRRLEIEREKAEQPRTEMDKYIANKEKQKGRPLDPEEKEDAMKEYYQLKKFVFTFKPGELKPEEKRKFISGILNDEDD